MTFSTATFDTVPKKNMKPNNSGSVIVWLILGIATFILISIAVVIWSKIFLVTHGLEQNQIDTYKNAIDKANDLKKKMEQRKKTEFDYSGY